MTGVRDVLEHLRQACQVCASLISLFKNLVYKNIEAQIRKTSPSGQRCVPTVSLHVLTKYVRCRETTGEYKVSPWPISAEKIGFCTGVTGGRTDGQTDRPTDRPSYRDAFLTDASKN